MTSATSLSTAKPWPKPTGTKSWRWRSSSSTCALPLAVGRRVAAQVDGDVEDLAAGAADQLRLAGLGLEVEAAQGALRGARVVVLDELDLDAELGPGVAAVGLDHEAALVAVDLRLEQDDPVELRRQRARSH